MKLYYLIIFTSILSQAYAASPLPSYLPSAPDAGKQLSAYTVGEVVGGTMTVSSSFADNHPLAKKGKFDLKAQWPGAKTATNIDAMLSYLLLTVNDSEESSVRNGLHWLLVEVMDVTVADKVAALKRVYDAQTDVGNKRKLGRLAMEVFPTYPHKDLWSQIEFLLDDATVVKVAKPEGASPRVVTVRGMALNRMRRLLYDKNMINFRMQVSDYEAIFKNASSETDACDQMKQWIANNRNQLEIKITTASNNPNRVVHKPVLRSYDPR